MRKDHRPFLSRSLFLLLLGAGCADPAPEPAPTLSDAASAQAVPEPPSDPPVAPEAAPVLPAPVQVDGTAARERRAAVLMTSFAHQQAFAVAEVRVVSSSVDVLATTEQDRPLMIATRHEVEVVRSWKQALPARVVLWTYGGRLADHEHPDHLPRGQKISHEAHLEPGMRALVALGESGVFAASPPLWRVLNGEDGMLSLSAGGSSALARALVAELDARYSTHGTEE
jgi:hypothetical protein